MLGTLETTACLGFGLLGAVTQGNLVEVLTPRLGVLLRHWLSVEIQLSHVLRTDLRSITLAHLSLPLLQGAFFLLKINALPS